jgi:hypothetical protein
MAFPFALSTSAFAVEIVILEWEETVDDSNQWRDGGLVTSVAREKLSGASSRVSF